MRSPPPTAPTAFPLVLRLIAVPASSLDSLWVLSRRLLDGEGEVVFDELDFTEDADFLVFAIMAGVALVVPHCAHASVAEASGRNRLRDVGGSCTLSSVPTASSKGVCSNIAIRPERFVRC